MTLKLDRLPEREAARITFTASAALKAALADYAEVYRRTYGCKESVAELIPFMLEAFINADPGFRRARRDLDRSRAAGSGQSPAEPPSTPPTPTRET